MRQITALLVLLAASWPAFASAQVKVGVVPESGLNGTPLSPTPGFSAPALQLSPSSLSAASLTPLLAAPAPAPAQIAVVPVAAAKAVPVAAAPVVAALTPSAAPALASIKAAAATPDKPGSDQALDAGTALFDGAGKLSAPAIGDGRFFSGFRSGNRSSGLSPPTNAELESAYRLAKPQSKAIEVFGRDFVAAAAQSVQKYTFMGEYFLQQIDPRSPGYSSAADLVAAHDARDSEPAVNFMRLLGRWMAFQDHQQEKLASAMRAMRRVETPRHLTPNPIPGGEYWDMAAGMNAQGFINRELDPNTKYSFFDYSPYVVSYLNTAAELAGVKNAKIVEGDIGALQKPEKPIAVLRTKNAVHYVPGFAKKLEEMADWVAPGGQLVIQNDPNPGQRKMILDGHGALIRRLLSEGWGIEYGFSGYDGKFGGYALDTLILTRPTAPAVRAADAAAREWKSYAAAVAKIDADFNPFGFLFR